MNLEGSGGVTLGIGSGVMNEAKTSPLDAKSQEGFVRMQFLAARPRAMAIGTWEDNSHARAFMETGAFKTMMGKLQAMVTGQPQQAIWDLKYYASK